MKVDIVIPHTFDAWVDGFANLEKDLLVHGLPIWRSVTDVFFDRTQSAVHIISGQLKASGRSQTKVEGGEIVGEVEYTADYAIYEFGRGGSHDAIGRGWESASKLFAEAMPAIWTATRASWR